MAYLSEGDRYELFWRDYRGKIAIDCIRELEAENATLRAAAEWQPIAEVPVGARWYALLSFPDDLGKIIKWDGAKQFPVSIYIDDDWSTVTHYRRIDPPVMEKE